MNRLFRIPTLVAVAGLILGSTAFTQAAFITGTQGLADIGSPTIPAGSSFATATQFNLSMIVATTSESGSFTTPGVAGMNFGAATLSLSFPSMFSFGNSMFGTFTASLVSENASADPTKSRSFNVFGNFTSGTLFGASSTNTASLIFTINSNSGVSGTSISDSASLSVPALVPEPASVGMLTISLLGLAGYSARRRLSK